MLHLPRKALDAIVYEAGAPRIGDLRHEPGHSVDDPVVGHLLSAVLAATARPQEAYPLFLDHLSSSADCVPGASIWRNARR
jgi:AraC family transcriptional regulator